MTRFWLRGLGIESSSEVIFRYNLGVVARSATDARTQGPGK